MGGRRLTSTATPALVTGLHDPADASAAPAAAARGTLAAHQGRYHIADPAKDLTAVDSESQGGRETVRLQQKYRGIPVLGGEYVVRMEKKSGQRTVTGTSGRYFTGLDPATVTPKVSPATATERALGAVRNRFGAAPLTRAAAVGKTRPLTGRDNGLTVLPTGKGVLTRHITVSGTDPRSGQPVQQEVYVDAQSGFPLMQYSGLQTFGSPSTAGTTAGSTAAATATNSSASGSSTAATPDDTATPAYTLVVKGSGVRYNGRTVDLNLYQGTDGAYQMYDYARMQDTSHNYLVTYDARGVEVAAASGSWPSGIAPFRSTTPDLTTDTATFTDTGAVDAHWAAGQVYDYYRSHFGRDGLDGNGSPIVSLVGVVSNGQPYDNAFWDGSKMVYGQGGDGYRTFSADADVVGHEMTHGVVQHTADLVYAGQSGAMNEALADYFGNAIDDEANGIPMTDPTAALLGEDLCTDKAPADCALRNLDDGATTQKNFVGAAFQDDDGGVHENSTIFSGALWNIREQLGGDLADKIVYRALTSYLTPLDGFTDGRTAVVAAATELGATKAQLKTINAAFDAHGITPDWESDLGVDSNTLVSGINTANTGVGAGGGWYAVSRSNEDGSEPYSVWAGTTDGKTPAKLISDNNGGYNVYPATDGKTVVWAEYGASDVSVMARPVSGGVEKTLFSYGSDISSLAVDGDYVVFTERDPEAGVDHVGYLNMATGQKTPTLVDQGAPYLQTALPSIHDGLIAYAEVWPDPTSYNLGVETYDIATGKTTLMPGDPKTAVGIGQTAVNGNGVYWLRDENLSDNGLTAVERAGLDGSQPTALLPESGPRALYAYSLTASDDAVTVFDAPPAPDWDNATLPKLYQVPATGDGSSAPQRVSCSRGEQLYPAADTGRQVVWLDGTTTSTNLVTRKHPAGTC
jgi:bacillolysin